MQRFCFASALLAVVACGGGDTPQPDATVGPPVGPPRETVTNTQTLQAGEIVEAVMNGGAADRAIIRLTAPVAELDWNIHAHPSGSSTITVHEELDVMTVEFDFVPTEPADWFLLLKNSGPATMDVEVEIDLYGAMTFGFI